MQENSLHPEQPYSSNTLKSLASTDSAAHIPMPDPQFERGLEGRRRKAAVTLFGVWTGTITLHLMPGGTWFVFGLTAFVGMHLLLIVFSRPKKLQWQHDPLDPFIAQSVEMAHSADGLPFVSLLVAAKNEETVIESLVHELCNLQYPSDRYELWVVDDASSDCTPELLDTLASKYSNLNVLHRPENAGGGKSGALNDVLSRTKGEILGVFDADAQVESDLLQSVVPLFQKEAIGAIQLRKSILNRDDNFWTRNQAAEMLFDSYMQEHRIAIGGIGELRGNGQFVRRLALEQCDGWNEQTITDDLDLTLRLHLNQWDIHFLIEPVVGEEGVTTGIALWHQRNRWAEGGYQRYLDYWRLITRNKLGVRKSVDLFVFWLLQYIMPTAAVPDALMAIARNRFPILSPLTAVLVLFSFIFMVLGVGQIRFAQLMTHPSITSERPLPQTRLSLFEVVKTSFGVLWSSIQGTLYMMHWIPIVATTTLRLAIRPKRLKWVKTTHHGKAQ